MINPCCCVTLQKAVMILAIFDVVLNVASFGVVIMSLIATVWKSTKAKGQASHLSVDEEVKDVTSCGLVIVKCGFEVMVALYLLRSAKKNDHRGCKRWLIFITFMCAVGIILDGLQYVVAPKTDSIAEMVLHGFLFLYTLFEIFVVFNFMKSIQPKTTKPYQSFGEQECQCQES